MTGDPRPDGGVTTIVEAPVEQGRLANVADIRTIAGIEYRLAVRNRWALALTAVFAAFALGLITFSGASVGPDGFDRIVASLAVLAVYLVPLGALAFGYDAIVGAEDNGWLQALFALPIRRWRVAIGTYLGRAIALVAAIAIGFGIAGGMLIAEFGLAEWSTYTVFMLGAIALGLSFLAIALVLSSLAREKTHALGGALVVWAWFVLVHDLLALGVIAAFRLSDAAVAALVLSNPAGVFRILVLGMLGAGGDAGFATVMSAAGLSYPVLVAAMIAWIVIPLIVAGVLIQRRRL